MPDRLGYLVVGATDPDRWSDFATGLLGLQAVDAGPDSTAFRMDECAARLFVERQAQESVLGFGWEVADEDALSAATQRLSDEGYAVAEGSDELAKARRVTQLAQCTDPDGNGVELFFGPQLAPSEFAPGRPISGFRTGELGLGHVAIATTRMDAMENFYAAILGFRLSDFAQEPFRARFFHLNSRHHSLALIEAPAPGLHHLMIEVRSLDDVGQAYDLALLDPECVAVSLGRHSNDHMTSFYARSPSGFMVEYGWGGRSIDPDAWQPVECVHGPSFWGHERHWLPEEGRAKAREMRLKAAASGVRAPDHRPRD